MRNLNFQLTFARPAAWRAAVFSLSLFGIFTFTGTNLVHADEKTILVLGDSLTAGFGLDARDSFPARLEMALQAAGHKVRVINGGVSGDTSAGGLARLGWLMQDRPDVVIVELGANDALRGQPPADTKHNLDRIIRELKARGTGVLLAGMRAPPNMGAAYAAEFDSIYPDLARIHDVPLYGFFLEGAIQDPDLMLQDGIHPNPDGVALIVERILPQVEDALRKEQK